MAASVIVMAEHLIAVLALLPVMLFRHRGRLAALTISQWLTVAFLGVGAAGLLLVRGAFAGLGGFLTGGHGGMMRIDRSVGQG
jgi:hypothetical protein